LNAPAVRSRFERYVYAAVALLLVALAIDGVFGAHGTISTYRLKLKVEKAQQQAGNLEQENKVFADEVRKLKTQPSAIENVARERMGLVKPGQLVFKLQPKSSARSSSNAPTPPGNR
jgi:cell division protein FtsB